MLDEWAKGRINCRSSKTDRKKQGEAAQIAGGHDLPSRPDPGNDPDRLQTDKPVCALKSALSGSKSIQVFNGGGKYLPM
jgi:hypothetical protein